MAASIPPIEVLLKSKRRVPVKPAALIFWFKYIVTVYVCTTTMVSAVDLVLTTDEIENVAIVSGLWMGGGGKKKQKEDEQDEKPENS